MKELVEIKFKEICAEYIFENLTNHNWEKTEFNPVIHQFSYEKPNGEFVRCVNIFVNSDQEIDEEFWKELIIQQIEHCEEEYKEFDIYQFYKNMKEIIDLETYSDYRELLDDKENIFQLFDFNFLPCEKIDKYYGINFEGFS